MKIAIILAVVLVIACASPFTATTADKPIKFDLDFYEDSPIGFSMKGQVSPRNEQQNKIETFLRLAGEYIPILESLANNDNSLTYTRRWHIGVLGFNLDVNVYFQLIVGWRVQPGNGTAGRFDVVYTPFAWGKTSAGINGTSWPAVGSTEAVLNYLDISAPISLSLYQAGRICFRGGYVAEAVTFHHNLYGSLRECQDEILDDLINGTPIFVWSCNYIAPVNTTIFDLSLVDGFFGDIVGETCIDF